MRDRFFARLFYILGDGLSRLPQWDWLSYLWAPLYIDFMATSVECDGIGGRVWGFVADSDSEVPA